MKQTYAAANKKCKIWFKELSLTTSSKIQHTFIAPFVAIALNDNPVKNVHAPQNATKISDCHTPPIPTILW